MHARGHGADVVGHARKLGGSPRVVKRKARRRNGDVVVDRPAEQLLALQHHADVAAQRPRVQTCQVAPAVAHGAALRNLEARRGKLFCGSFFCGVCGGLLDHDVLLGYGAFLDFSRLVGFGILHVGKFGHNGAFLETSAVPASSTKHLPQSGQCQYAVLPSASAVAGLALTCRKPWAWLAGSSSPYSAPHTAHTALPAHFAPVRPAA